MKIHTILPGALYQSRNMLNVHNRIELLQQYGITTVVNCWNDDPVLAAQKEIRYLHAPLSDGKNVPENTLYLAKSLAKTITEDHACILMMCHAGRNRSGLLSTLVVRELKGCTGAQALRIVRQGRPRSCGSNLHFEKFLQALPRPNAVA